MQTLGRRALSSVWTECLASDQVVAGSNPAAPIPFWNDQHPTDSGDFLITSHASSNLISSRHGTRVGSVLRFRTSKRHVILHRPQHHSNNQRQPLVVDFYGKMFFKYLILALRSKPQGCERIDQKPVFTNKTLQIITTLDRTFQRTHKGHQAQSTVPRFSSHTSLFPYQYHAT